MSALRVLTHESRDDLNDLLLMDAVGANAGLAKPFTWNVPDKKGLPVPYPEIADMLTHPGGACELDRMPIPCEIMNSLMEAGALKSEYPNYREPSDSNRISAKNHPSSRPLQKDIINHGLGLFEIWVPPDFRYERYNGWVVFVSAQDSLPNDLKQQVQNISTNCADYMNRLLNQLGSKYTAETFGDLFDRIGTNHMSIDHNEFVRVGEPTSAGLAEDHPRRIFINTGVTAIARVTTFELLHHAASSGMFDDHKLDNAVIKLMNPDAQKKALGDMKAKGYVRSTIAHKQLNNNCFNKGG